MILKGKNRPTRIETFHSAAFTITSPIFSGLESNLGLQGERPVANLVRYVMARDTQRNMFA
jgi:hypothetical protein